MSSYLDFSVKTKAQFIRYILLKLGAPLVSVELSEEQIGTCINDATEMFSKFASPDQKFMVIKLDDYVEGVGITLPSDIMSIFSLTRDGAGSDFGNLFSMDSSMMYSLMNYQSPIPRTFSFITFELAKNYMSMINMYSGKGFDFNYNERTKILVLYPDPKVSLYVNMVVVLGCFAIRPEDQIYGEEWVKREALAEAKILLGTIRKKFSSVQLLGGGTVDASIGEEGRTDRDKLIEELQSREGPVCSFVVQ